jgi:hypothetical protein
MRIFLIFLIVFIFYKLQAEVYAKRCFKNVEVEAGFNLLGIFQGERAELKETFINRKLLLLWWVGIKFQVSRHLVFQEDKNDNEGNDNFRKELFSILPYEKITKKFSVAGSKRGFYRIESLELTTGDLFGKYKIIKSYPCSAELYVYPRIIASDILDIHFMKMNGDILTKRHLVEDPFQLRGIREYHPYDSLKSVNWNATARSGELKVNQYNFTASQQVVVLMNIERNNAWDPEALVEECISLAASITMNFIKLGMKVELITNGCDIVTSEKVKVLPGAGVQHNIEIYESLSRLDISKVSEPIECIFGTETTKLRNDAVYILISHYFGEKLINEVKSAQHRGLDIKWLLPKDSDTKINFELDNGLFIWEVKDI